MGAKEECICRFEHIQFEPGWHVVFARADPDRKIDERPDYDSEAWDEWWWEETEALYLPLVLKDWTPGTGAQN
jgi:hypothetical protein